MTAGSFAKILAAAAGRKGAQFPLTGRGHAAQRQRGKARVA